MAVQVDPISNPLAWATIRVATVNSPGLCKVTGFKREHEWDIKKGKGASGGTITFVQRPPAKGQIVFQAWTSAHFLAWNAFLPLFKYDPTKRTVTPVDIYHPGLSDIDINSIVAESLGVWENAGLGMWQRAIDCLEYFPPPPISAVSTPLGAIATTPGSTSPGLQPDPTDVALQAQIAALMAKAAQP